MPEERNQEDVPTEESPKDQPSSALSDDTHEVPAIADGKSVAEQAAFLSNLALADVISNINLAQQNAVSNQQAMNQLGLTITGKAVNFILDRSPVEVTDPAAITVSGATSER